MKILHVIEKIEKAAGTTTFCVRVAEELARLGHQVAILIHHRNPACDATPRYDVQVIQYVPGAPLPFKPDIVHIHGIWPPWQHFVQRNLERKGYPIVLSPHGMLAPWAMAHKRWKKLLPWFIYQKWDIRRSKMLFTTASLETTWVQALGFKNPIAEIPLGTDIPEGKELAPHNAPVNCLAFVGRIYPVKGLDLLLKAWKLVKASIPDWHLLLIGPDQAGYVGELEQLAQQLNLSVRHGDISGADEADVTFTGPLYGEEKDRALLFPRGLILPSYTENFGGVVLDALALGLPVLASKATPWGILEESGCGSQFELTAEALYTALISLLLKKDAERQAMGYRGHQLIVERYTWPAIGLQVEQAYKPLLKDCD